MNKNKNKNKKYEMDENNISSIKYHKGKYEMDATLFLCKAIAFFFLNNLLITKACSKTRIKQ